MRIQEHVALDALTDDALGILRAIGVDDVSIMHPPAPQPDLDMTETWRDVRRTVESHGMRFNNVGLRPDPSITLARSDRDQHIEGWIRLIRSMGAAGVPTLSTNFRGIGNFRTESAKGRGGARYSTFDYAEFMADPPSHPDQQIDEATLRDNLAHFMRILIPVAEAEGVVITMHPDDPPRPEPLAGAARVLSTLNDFERLFEVVPSPSNSMLFCQGCVAEMGEDVPSAIRRVAALGKISAVHFRNIRGGPDHFEETFLDEGDGDMLLYMQTYRDVGFEGPFMMDHTPGTPHEGWTHPWVGRAVAVGYIRSLIQAVYR